MKRLILQADDFGMTHEVNLGIVRAFTHGLVTQATIMAPCPWFTEAAALAKLHRIPVGVHLTATCEWEFYRWRPLTDGKSLGRPLDGTCHATLAEARSRCDPAELEREFIAQIERVLASGLVPDHLDVHMGVVDQAVFNALCARYRLPSLAPRRELPSGSPHNPVFATDPGDAGSALTYVSGFPLTDKSRALRAYLEGLADGTHFNASHPAVDGEENRGMCRAEDPSFPWARNIRVTDYIALTDPGIVALAARLGIEKASMAAA